MTDRRGFFATIVGALLCHPILEKIGAKTRTVPFVDGRCFSFDGTCDSVSIDEDIVKGLDLTMDELVQLAEDSPPPHEYFDGDMAKPW